MKLAVNDNIPDGGMGSICWARWELSRNLLRGTLYPEQAEEAATELRGQLPAIREALRGPFGQLPNDVARFAAALHATVSRPAFVATLDVPTEGADQRKRAEEALMEAGNTLFANEPAGAKAYIDHAKAVTSCKTP